MTPPPRSQPVDGGTAEKPKKMPFVNHVVLASGAVVAVSLVATTAIAIYESPEFQRYTEDIRRRIIMAFNSIGGSNSNNADISMGAPRFNRPEDADGFLQSRGIQSGEPGVDADDESRRKQREELMYWNSVLLEKESQAQQEAVMTSALPPTALKTRSSRGSSFDDFLKPDKSGEHGTYVFNSGANIHSNAEGLRHRGGDAAAAGGFMTPLYANPFADEHQIGRDEILEHVASRLPPEAAEAISDIYSATTRDDVEDRERERRTATLEPEPAQPATLVDISDTTSDLKFPPPLSRELTEVEPIPVGGEEEVEEGGEDQADAFASIQAWAHESSRDFYSPLPVTPQAPISEPEWLSEGQLTPTDSMSIIGSVHDVANDAASTTGAGENGRYFDVMSESDGMETPASWSEVGSVISESDAPVHA